ncbi:MAG: topoisomerase, partial [Candidatus Peribacteria bacterium]|nr:topoisomerase [Candidatus Peribacteria bacterium]
FHFAPCEVGAKAPERQRNDIITFFPMDINPLDVTLESGIDILKKSKAEKEKAAKPLRTLDISPVTGKPVLVKDGRFGPYLTDGVTNCSLGKKRDPEKITFEEAVELIAKKVERGPSKWKRRG